MEQPCFNTDVNDQKCAQLRVDYSYVWFGSIYLCHRFEGDIENVATTINESDKIAKISLWSGDQCPNQGHSMMTYSDLEWSIFICCLIIPILILMVTQWIDQKVDQVIQRYRHQYGVPIPSSPCAHGPDTIESESDSETEILII